MGGLFSAIKKNSELSKQLIKQTKVISGKAKPKKEVNAKQFTNLEDKVPEKTYTWYDYRTAKSFFAKAKRNNSELKSLKFGDEDCLAIKKLRKDYGYEQPIIESVLDYILNEWQSNGFVLCARELVRVWKNSNMIVFDEAQLDQKKALLKRSSLDVFEIDIELRPYAQFERNGVKRKVGESPGILEYEDIQNKKLVSNHAERIYENLMLNIPHPNWNISNSDFLQYEQFLYDLSILFEEFIIDRHWWFDGFLDSEPGNFFPTFLKQKVKSDFYTVESLKNNLFKFFCSFETLDAHRKGAFYAYYNDDALWLTDNGYIDALKSYLARQGTQNADLRITDIHPENKITNPVKKAKAIERIKKGIRV